MNGYYTNTSVYPYPVVLLQTNFTAVYDTNNVLLSQTATTGTYTNIIYITTYLTVVPYYITNIYQATPPASATTNVVQTSYGAIITPPINNLFSGNDTNINQIAFGDGVLDVCDVYVTFRRSLDSTLTWYERFWTNGVRVADTGIPNHAAHVVTKSANAKVVQPLVQSHLASAPPLVIFSAGNVQGTAGQTVQVPISATISGIYPLRLLMLNLSVESLTNAPLLTASVQFTQSASALGNPYTTDSTGNGNYSAVWLNDANTGATGAGLTGTVTIGNLAVTIPANAPRGATYGVNFDHASASPNGLASFPNQTVTGYITVK